MEGTVALWSTVTSIAGSDTFWSSLSAVFTGAAAVGIWIAVKQLRFDAWLKAQEIFTEEKFTQARGVVFARLGNIKSEWTSEQREAAALVCRRMNELAQLEPYLGKKRILSAWDDPLAKAWFVLESFVRDERNNTGWSTKWDAFEKLGKQAQAKLKVEGHWPPVSN